MESVRQLVGILVSGRSRRKQTLKQYLTFPSSRMKLFCFTSSGIDWKRGVITGLHRSGGRWRETRFPFPQVVYNRRYSPKDRTIVRLSERIGRSKIFNHINQFNKLQTHECLKLTHGEYLPYTALYERGMAAELLERHRVLYFKPCFGYRGEGVYRAELLDSGEIHVGDHYYTPKIALSDLCELDSRLPRLLRSGPYMVQQGIATLSWNGQTFDMRALVQKNRTGVWSITNIVSRIAYPGCFNTSVAEKVCLSQELLGSLFDPETTRALLESMGETSLAAAQALEAQGQVHLGEISVDFTLDQGARIWLIEVNGKPQKDLYDGIYKQYRVYKRPIEYARYLARK